MSAPTDTSPGPTLPGQFVLLRAARAAAAEERLRDWTPLELPNGWALLAAPGAPVRRLVGPEGERLGALVDEIERSRERRGDRSVKTGSPQAGGGENGCGHTR